MSLGINAKVYRNTGTWGSPTWTEVPEFESVQIDPRYTEGESNSRDSRFARGKLTLAGCSATARLKVKPGNTNFESLMDAFALATAVDLLILDGPRTTVGSRGIRAEFNLMAAGDDQGITSRLYRDLALNLNDSDNLPKWAKVVTGPTIQYAEPGGSWA
jgi:hypothetical protein